jgi:hypothetical protein
MLSKPNIKFLFSKIIYSILEQVGIMFIREVIIFIAIFLFLALGMHMNQWLTHPIEHLQQLSIHKMPYHPLLYSIIVYILLGIIRAIFNTFMKLFRRK